MLSRVDGKRASRVGQPAVVLPSLRMRRRSISAACLAFALLSCARRTQTQSSHASVDASVSPQLAAFAESMRRCDKDDFQGCYEAAHALQEANGVPRNDMLAVQLLTRACAHLPAACNDLGELYRLGHGADKDEAKAAHNYQLACDGGDQFGCANLAQALVTGAGIPKDEARGVQLFQRACDAKDVSSCFNAGVALDNGIGGRANRRQAASDYRHACDGGIAMACSNLGVLLAKGDGVAKSEVAALENFEKGCVGEIAQSCRNAGVLLKKSKLPREGRTPSAFFGRACKLGDRASCDELAKAGTL